MSPYETLGVGREATPEDVKRAYRKKALETHPDKGGAEGAFPPVQRAYALLSDPRRRSAYDRTGQDPGEVADPRVNALRRLAGLFLGAVEELEPDAEDIIARVRVALGNMASNARKEVEKLRARVRKLERAKKCLRVAGGKEDHLTPMLEAQSQHVEAAIARGSEELESIALMTQLLGDYGWELPDVVLPSGGVYLDFQWRTG